MATGVEVSSHEVVGVVVHDSVVEGSSEDSEMLLVSMLSDDEEGSAGKVMVKSTVVIGPVCVGIMGSKNVLVGVGTVRVKEAVISPLLSLLAPGRVEMIELGTMTGPTPLCEPSMSEKMERSLLPTDEAEMAERERRDWADESSVREADGRGVTKGELVMPPLSVLSLLGSLSVTVNVCTNVVEPDS